MKKVKSWLILGISACTFIMSSIKAQAQPETGVSNGQGRIFMNSETTDEVEVIDTDTYQAIGRFKIIDRTEPSGLTMDQLNNCLSIGCGGTQTLAVLDAANGTNIAKFHTGDCDGVAFYPVLKQAYSSNSEGTMSGIREINPDKFVFVENVLAKKSACTMWIDLNTHHLFLPAAQTEAIAAIANDTHLRQRIVPGSFLHY